MRKKKNDGNEIKVPAKAETDTVPAATNTPEKKIPTVTSSITAEDTVQYKTADKPVTSFKDLNISSGFRLQQSKQVVQQAAVEEQVKETPALSNEKFELENVQFTASNFAKLMQEKGKKQVANMLRPEMLLLKNGTEVIIEIENSAQKESFEPVRQDFLDYLRKNLNNGTVSIRMEEKVSDGTKKAYTPAEKFETMMKKNPALLELKKRLDMEVDY